MDDSLADAFEREVAQLPPDVRNSACGLIEMGRRCAQRFDEGHNPAASQVRLALADLRKLTDRWERLRMPPAPDVMPERSPLDELRERRRRQMGESAG